MVAVRFVIHVMSMNESLTVIDVWAVKKYESGMVLSTRDTLVDGTQTSHLMILTVTKKETKAWLAHSAVCSEVLLEESCRNYSTLCQQRRS
jgi:hypothetical protein